MTTALNLPIEIVACETIREQNGLAKSSRNLRLSEKGKDVAKIIFQTLKLSKEWMKYYTPPEIQEKVFNMITKKGLVVEYVSIFNPDTLQELTTWQTNSHMAIAAQCEGIRLIDNLELS
jgi:pantoate--beta-alanine ligase